MAHGNCLSEVVSIVVGLLSVQQTRVAVGGWELVSICIVGLQESNGFS